MDLDKPLGRINQEDECREPNNSQRVAAGDSDAPGRRQPAERFIVRPLIFAHIRVLKCVVRVEARLHSKPARVSSE
jgi:hypothetical protein